MRTELMRQLRGDEGVEPCAYQDSLGYWTIGTGRLVDRRRPGAGLRPVEMDFMLQNDIDDRINALGKRLPWFQDLDDARKGVLLNMSFQLGVDGLLGFHATLALLQRGDYEAAANNMLRSKWARQTPARALRLSEQVRTGVWQYAPGA
ncbi:glycoside hydrolase family protein [Ramlibacter tataouinensis]|uniref:Lysozyme n=1 Tax=Ramlibacter tataouinensis (strain ATCC BAA-407 / DSM 14655 / LMG 21543 / TTB310) TaxID=365046 RepID=F5XYQ5_RAMTT|nr:glycoside hydrolase family protein [Ramlibacter tataouinensis]AEG94422.1 candidate lysozyme, Glycoside Hydrolase Family 24 [Ramlibacter tataouinensis TTB310]